MDESCDRLLKVKKSCNIAPGVVDLTVVEDENYIKGGILSNPKLSWVSCGPRITNLNNLNGSKKTGWTFGWASGDKSIRVTCVEELPGNSAASPILIVGCESENGSSLCFYHSGCSRVLKAIHFSDKITSLAVVSKSNDLEEGLSELLKSWNGIVAVGTSIGKVYLIDIWWRALERCVDDFRHKLYDEQRQSKLAEVTINDLENNIDCRTSSIRHGSATLALWLNEVTMQQGQNGHHPGLQNILGRMPLEFLTVSALKYFPQISTLAVGYNTSCFQLWDISSLTLLYTSALLEAMLPVFSFCLLEPSDDPRYVCYLWSLHHSEYEDNIPFAGMYIISYHEKHQKQYSNQFFYEGFSSCSIRYQLDLGAEMADVVSGRIISCQSINRSTTKSSPHWIHTEYEDSGGEEGTASLLSIVWEAWSPNQLNVYRKLTLFDLNQWYREYMPTSSDMEYLQFMAHFCLPDGQLLDAKIMPSSVKQFQALQPLDEHFYPTATTFECLLLQQCQLVVCCHVGLQQEALEALIEAGPSGLLLPTRLYKQCTQAGLRPLLVEIGSPSSMQSSVQRNYLLCVALENEMTQFLRRCAADWADGSHAVAGCTLPGLLTWAWGRVQNYKKWLDRLCVPLFDYSGSALDTNDLGNFHHMVCQLHRLHDLFHFILEKYSHCIIRGNFEQQYTVINLVIAFYDSVFWCVRNKILPEVNTNEANISGCVPYFADKIINSTISRRAELHQLAKSLQHSPPLPSLLLIDTVISMEAGAKVVDQWEREGGSATLGKYPPPSVQSLLRIYLVRGVQANIKHFIVTYFLHDIAHVLCSLGVSDTIKHKLLKYPTNFGLTESQSKIVEAFWCLDHKQFQLGVDLLLDSCVDKEDLQVYQHRTVLCLLTAVGEHKLALHYLTTRRRTSTEPQDIRMEMTLLLVNDLIHEAFQFQRHHRAMSTELLEQFFKGCVEMNKLDVVFKLALNPAEEEAFMAFLEKTSHPQADDLRVLYLLSRSRYVEAIDMNERLHSAVPVQRGMGLSPAPKSHKTLGLGTRGNNRPPSKTLTTRDLIISSVAKSLPSITRDLADYCHREKHFSWKQINRPTPLSVVVHTELSNDRLPYYKSSDSQLIQAAVSKTREIWAPLLATPAALKRKMQSTVEDTPFLRNPIHSRLNSSVTNTEEDRSGIRRRTDDEEFKISKRARLEFTPTERENSVAENILDKTSDMDMTCHESNSVLHTPLVARIVKKAPRETTTPQSILKGRSGPNTPLTPAREKLGSPAVGRQIRFSLPREDSSPSPSKSVNEDEEGDYLTTTLSSRKPIHKTSDLNSRLPTPSNPRVSQKILSRSLRNSVTQLQFDKSETPPVEEMEPEPSATAVTILKKVSSPLSSEESYLSFRSTSSGLENKSGSESKFKISFGLEGNIVDDEVVGSQQQDRSYTKDDDKESDVSIESGEVEKQVESNEMETTITQTKSKCSDLTSGFNADQTNESLHLTLEDTASSSVHKINEHLTQSVTTPTLASYFSFRSTSSGLENKSGSESKFKISFGLEGNIVDDEVVEIQQQNKTYSKDVEKQPDVSIESGEIEKEVESNEMETTITQTKSKFSDVSSSFNADQTNNSLHLTLEYSEDSSSSSVHKINEHLTQSITENKIQKLTPSDGGYSGDVELKAPKSVDKKVEKDTIGGRKLDKKTKKYSTLPSVRDSKSVEHDIEMHTKEEEKLDGNITQDSILPSVCAFKSVEQEIEIYTKEDKRVDDTLLEDSTMSSGRALTSFEQDIEIHNIEKDRLWKKITKDSTQGSVSTLESGQQKIETYTIEEEKFDKIIQDSTMSSDGELKTVEEEIELKNIDEEGVESAMQDSALRSVRGSTPLPQILEELVKKGRISLSVPEKNKDNESYSNLQEKGVPTETNRLKNNFPISSISEIVNVEDIVKEDVFINPQEEIESNNKSATHINESETRLSSEVDNISKNDESLPKTANNSSLNQVFVFGNQASLSETITNRNLTYVIGSSHYDNITSEEHYPTIQELTNNKLESSMTDKGEAEPEKVETSKKPSVIITETWCEAQICSTTEDPIKPTETTLHCQIEDVCDERSSNVLLAGNNEITNSLEISSIYTCVLPEDGQHEVFDFYPDTAGSTCIKQLEADSTADFELKMSEGESVVEIFQNENNEVEAAQEEPVLETLRPVEYQVEEVEAMVEDNYRNELDNVEELENGEDIEDEQSVGESKEDEYSETESENEQEKEVICLGSSSDEEEPPTKSLKSSTPYSRQLTPKATKLEETLDYEEEDLEDEDQQEDDDESSEEEKDDNESYSSESCLDEGDKHSERDESDSKIEKKNLYFSSESDSDTSRQRRSWKLQKKEYDSNESLAKEYDTNDEDTVESPPFELISQDSKEGEKSKLETITDVTVDNQKIEEDASLSSISVLNHLIDVNKAEERKQEPLSKSNKSPEGKESNSLLVETSERGRRDVDIVKLAEESRQRRLETGSILDLKKRRSKRYSSSSDLSENKKAKLRRRSCSLHDFMSAFIKETKSVNQSSPEKEIVITNDESNINISQVSTDLTTEEPRAGSPTKIISALKTQTSTISEMDFSETGSVTSSLMPEVGSLATQTSTQTSVCDFPISSLPKPFETLKKRGKSFASRLHDISEEISDNPENFRYPSEDSSINKTLKRSLSTDQLTVSTQMDESRTRRSSSVCRWSEYAKAHESEMIADTTDIRSSSAVSCKADSPLKSMLPVDFQKMKYVTRKSKLRSSGGYINSLKTMYSSDEEESGKTNRTIAQDKEGKESQHNSTSTTDVVEEDSNVVNTSKLAGIASQSSESNRWQRAQSEPSSIFQTSEGIQHSRRSTSLMKINEHHKRFLYRSSLRRKTIIEQQQFEILDSDAESPRETVSREKKEKALPPQSTATQENETKIFENDLANEQVGSPTEAVTAVESPKMSPNIRFGNRMMRGQSEPPTMESDLPKRTRTRRSSYSHQIEKIHKLILPRTRKSRASSFQPMEIVQSDEEKSFQKDSDKSPNGTALSESENEDIVISHVIRKRGERKQKSLAELGKTYNVNNQDQVNFESGLEAQNNKEILETPVTSKKRGRPKKQQNQTKENLITDPTEDTKIKEPSLSNQEDPQNKGDLAIKTTQDYPQPPKKRGRPKHKTEEIAPNVMPTSLQSDHYKEIVTDSKVQQEISPVQEKINVTKSHDKKQGGKNSKRNQQIVKSKENEDHSVKETLKSLQKGDPKGQTFEESPGLSKKTGPKKRNITSKVKTDHSDKEDLNNVIKDKPEEHIAEVNSGASDKSGSRNKKVTKEDSVATPKKILKRRNKEEGTPFKQQCDSENVESSLTESQKDEMTKPSKISKEQELLLLDSPARRTRRSMSRLSDTEMLTPTKEKPQRRIRRTSAMSDVVLSTPNKYAESDISDASTEVNMLLNTPTRKSNRRPSFSATPNTPEIIPEEFLMQRRLTRHQHSQLQKSFELSFVDSPKLSRLEEVPEESGESEESSLTSVRSSKRTKATPSKSAKAKLGKK